MNVTISLINNSIINLTSSAEINVEGTIRNSFNSSLFYISIILLLVIVIKNLYPPTSGHYDFINGLTSSLSIALSWILSYLLLISAFGSNSTQYYLALFLWLGVLVIGIINFFSKRKKSPG